MRELKSANKKQDCEIKMLRTSIERLVSENMLLRNERKTLLQVPSTQCFALSCHTLICA